MRMKMIVPAALMLGLVSATGAFAQNSQYDRTGDHMFSYGPASAQPSASVNPRQASQQSSRRYAPVRAQSQERQQLRTAPVSNETQTSMQPESRYDRTGDHMFSYGPSSGPAQ